MRNKLKRSKKCKDGSYPSKDPQRTAEVTTVELAGSSSSNHEAPPAKDRHGSGVSAAGVPVGQEHRNTFCAEDIKIAPIFLRSAQHSQSQRGSEGTPGKPAEKLQTSVQSEDVQLVQSQQRLSAVSYLRKRCRGQLSPSTLHSCLKEIQTSNPAFPVRAVFNTLQKKTSLQDFGSTGEIEHNFEDVLWTDKYSPQHSSEVIGNSASVNKLQSWLKKWKLRADCEERRKLEERNQEEKFSMCGTFWLEKKEPLCNTMLITGPPGVGKTAAVYACSQELGFKVFEVNCSSQRSGRHVLSQLKEATQSHLVEMSGKDPLKPTYFNNYNNKETLSGRTYVKTWSPVTSKKIRKGKVNPSKVTLANYFKMKAKADHLHLGGLSPSEKPDGKTSGSPSPGSDQTVPQNKNTATSLILFEEVDVIFDDDVGFLTAIKTFMATTKRPVILTTNDSSFRERFNCTLEEIIFKTPSAVNVCSYLQLVGLAENARLELEDISSLLRLCGGDVRRCLLQLQLWVHSGGRWACQKGDCPFWSEMDMTELLRLLAESWRGGVPLLYANLELFLPIGAKGTSVHFLEKGTCSGLKSSSAKRSSSRTPRSRDATDQNTAKVALDCLDALTDFFDLMSYLDATMPAAEPLVSGLCRPEAFCWTGAVMKDGLLDEMSEEEEEHRSWSQEKLLDIQAAVEGLGCHRCLWRMSEAWTEAQKYTQELGDTWWASQSLVSSKRQSLSFSVQPLCAPSVSQRRYELSRSVLGSKSFSLLGNREAVSVDYMPVLRYICRFQREQRQKEEPVR
uniref:AAA+ ATPase domain-containing protein n=1 Tax=Dicentrarchus labrax TaxID=13489 RepID=A0A8C4DRS7_DICLA